MTYKEAFGIQTISYARDTPHENFEEAREKLFEACWKADKYRWHDLRKDPTDLPDDYRLVDCRTTDKQPFYYGNYDSEFSKWYDSEGFSMQVVAWREVEHFDAFMHEAEGFRDALMNGLNEVDEELVERVREHGRRAERELAAMMTEEE